MFYDYVFTYGYMCFSFDIDDKSNEKTITKFITDIDEMHKFVDIETSHQHIVNIQAGLFKRLEKVDKK